MGGRGKKNADFMISSRQTLSPHLSPAPASLHTGLTPPALPTGTCFSKPLRPAGGRSIRHSGRGEGSRRPRTCSCRCG